MVDSLISPPRLHGTMSSASLYSDLGQGLTDTIMIIGHADGIELNDPVRVLDLKKVVKDLGYDGSSPLLRGLLEAYYAGARDIWIVAAAPMDEYVSDIADRFDPSFGGNNFYEQYNDRLTTCYSIVGGREDVDVVVPLNAPIFGAGSVDFLTPLADFCANDFLNTGVIKIGLIGTAFENLGSQHVEDMVTDLRLSTIGGKGKFIVPMIGSGIFNLPEIPTAYSSSPIASMAGFLSQQYWDRGLTHCKVPNMVGLDFGGLTKQDQKRLCEAKLNPLARTARSRRGIINDIVLLTDNTLGEDGSDFWSITQVRLIMQCVRRITALGNRHLGTIGYGQFKVDVETFMLGLVVSSIIRDYRLQIDRLIDPVTKTITAVVDLSVRPFFGLREIAFTATVGMVS